jgi:hypothetical protein
MDILTYFSYYLTAPFSVWTQTLANVTLVFLDHSEDVGIDEKVILEWILEKRCEDVD